MPLNAALIYTAEGAVSSNSRETTPSVSSSLAPMLGRTAEAAAAYREALSLEVNDADRRLLEGRLAALSLA